MHDRSLGTGHTPRTVGTAGLTDRRPYQRLDRWTGASVYEGECQISNFVADAYRWVADADVGLQNSGAIRADRPLRVM